MTLETHYFQNQCAWLHFDNYEEYLRIVADDDIYLAFVGLFKPLDMATSSVGEEESYLVLAASELFPYSDHCIYPNFSLSFFKSPDDNHHITLTLKALNDGYEHYNRVIKVDVEPGKFRNEPRDKSATSFGNAFKRLDLVYANPKEECSGMYEELTMDDIKRAAEYLDEHGDEVKPRGELWELTYDSEQPGVWLGVDRDEEIKAQNVKHSVYSGTQTDRKIKQEAKPDIETERKTQMDVLWNTIKNASK